MAKGKDENTYGFNRQDAERIVQNIESGDGWYREGLVRSGGGSQVFTTPSGGIAARSGSTLGSATCTKVSVSGGTRTVSANTATVYNDFRDAISGTVDIVATRINGIWLAIAEDCSSSGVTTASASGGSYTQYGGGAALSVPADGVYQLLAEQSFISFDLNGSGGPLEPV